MATFASSHNQHRYSIEDELFVLRPSGEVNPLEARFLADEMRRVAGTEGRIFLLISLDGMQKPPPDTRKVMSKTLSTLPLRAAAYFGGGLIIRTVLTLVNRASMILRGGAYPVRFCTTESEARAWLTIQRAEALVPPSPPSQPGPFSAPP